MIFSSKDGISQYARRMFIAFSSLVFAVLASPRRLECRYYSDLT
jgi:hypothetical protein